MLRLRSCLPLAALTLAPWACGPGDEQPETAATDSLSVAETAPPVAERGQLPAAGDQTYLVRLVGLEGARPTGTVGFEPQDGGARAVVRLEGAGASGVHQGHLHQGASCDAIGAVIAPLPPLDVGQDGTATAEAALQMSLDSIMTGNSLVVYHEAGGSPGRPLVCGSVPRLPPNLPA